MASKVYDTTDSATGLALQRGTGIAPASDHNQLASLRQRDGHMLRDLTPGGIVAGSSDRCTFDDVKVRIATPTDPINALLHGIYIEMGPECEEAGVVGSAGTTWLIDLGLETASDNFWQYGWVGFTSGVCAGLWRQVSSFEAATKRVSWQTPLPSAPAATDTFVLTFLYVEDLTNAATNYVFMALGSKTTLYGIARFYANVTGTPSSPYDLLVATATLDGAGVVTAVDNNPTGADRYLYPIVGRYDDDVQSVTVHESIEPGASVTYYATHAQMAAVAGLEVSISEEDFSYVIVEHYEDDRVRLTITNDSAYASAPTVTLTRKGIRLVTL